MIAIGCFSILGLAIRNYIRPIPTIQVLKDLHEKNAGHFLRENIVSSLLPKPYNDGVRIELPDALPIIRKRSFWNEEARNLEHARLASWVYYCTPSRYVDVFFFCDEQNRVVGYAMLRNPF